MTPEEVSAVSRWQLSVFEKVVGGAILALLGWMAWTVQTTSTQVAVIEAKLTVVAADNYTSKDADRDIHLTDEKIAALAARVAKLEGAR